MMGYWGGYGYGPMGMGIFGGALMIIFWVLFIALILLFMRRLMWSDSDMWRRDRWRHYRDMQGREERDSALDILKERYAKGEITKQEFEQMKKDLE